MRYSGRRPQSAQAGEASLLRAARYRFHFLDDALLRVFFLVIVIRGQRNGRNENQQKNSRALDVHKASVSLKLSKDRVLLLPVVVVSRTIKSLGAQSREGGRPSGWPSRIASSDLIYCFGFGSCVVAGLVVVGAPFVPVPLLLYCCAPLTKFCGLAISSSRTSGWAVK